MSTPEAWVKYAAAALTREQTPSRVGVPSVSRLLDLDSETAVVALARAFHFRDRLVDHDWPEWADLLDQTRTDYRQSALDLIGALRAGR